MKKTKVVCTMGPNTNDRELMRKLIQNGMDVARFNFSHGDHEEQKGFARKSMQRQLFFWIQRDQRSVQVF